MTTRSAEERNGGQSKRVGLQPRIKNEQNDGARARGGKSVRVELPCYQAGAENEQWETSGGRESCLQCGSAARVIES